MQVIDPSAAIGHPRGNDIPEVGRIPTGWFWTPGPRSPAPNDADAWFVVSAIVGRHVAAKMATSEQVTPNSIDVWIQARQERIKFPPFLAINQPKKLNVPLSVRYEQGRIA